MTKWQSFWLRFLSPETARFILALLAIGMAQYAMQSLMGQEIKIQNRDALMLALGIILGLSKDAYSYYFGSTARSDEKATEPTTVKVANTPNDPVPTTDTPKNSTLPAKPAEPPAETTDGLNREIQP